MNKIYDKFEDQGVAAHVVYAELYGTYLYLDKECTTEIDGVTLKKMFESGRLCIGIMDGERVVYYIRPFGMGDNTDGGMGGLHSRELVSIFAPYNPNDTSSWNNPRYSAGYVFE